MRNPNIERVRDLDEIPSPFLEGAFDSIMAANPQESWIGLWETNRGCPFRCTFCDWGSATAAKVTKFGEERLYREVDWFAEKKIEYIFCCDANFGIQKRDVDIAKYVAGIKQDTGYPVALSVQNTKNATERAYETQKILSDAGLNKGVALSMQSVDMTTLEAIKRDNISLGTYMELQRRFTRDKVETYSDLILGLPGETYELFVRGVDQLIENGQHNRIQFNNLSILPNAEMGDPAYQAKYGMVTVESKIINIHGERIELDDDVPEVQDLVVATAAMPLADWRRTRVFCWMTALLHFDKLFQIPAHPGPRHLRHLLPRHDRGLHGGRSRALSDDRGDQRLLPQRGGIDPAGRLGVRLLEGISRHLLAGRRVHLRQADGRGKVRRLLCRSRQASRRDRERQQPRPADGHHRRGDPAQPCAGAPAVRQGQPQDPPAPRPARLLAQGARRRAGAAARDAAGDRGRS